MNFYENHRIDPDKIETVEDVAEILDALNIRIAPDYENFDQLKPYLTEVEEEKTSALHDPTFE